MSKKLFHPSGMKVGLQTKLLICKASCRPCDGLCWNTRFRGDWIGVREPGRWMLSRKGGDDDRKAEDLTSHLPCEAALAMGARAIHIDGFRSTHRHCRRGVEMSPLSMETKVYVGPESASGAMLCRPLSCLPHPTLTARLPTNPPPLKPTPQTPTHPPSPPPPHSPVHAPAPPAHSPGSCCAESLTPAIR